MHPRLPRFLRSRATPRHPLRLRYKTARALEIAAWSAAVLLLTAYGGARWWYVLGRADDLADFGAVQALRGKVTRVGRTESSLAFVDVAIDVSAWSKSRLTAYRKSYGTGVLPEAVLRIPRLKLIVPVYDGTSEINLNRGAGRIEGTARIGKPGNIGLAAHRDGFFRVLKDVQIGDTLILEQRTATHVYTVAATHIVEPSETGVLSDMAAPALTLVTCYPFYFVGPAPKRFIVQAQIVPTKHAGAAHF